MITKELARNIYNCHSQIEMTTGTIGKLKSVSEMIKNKELPNDIIPDKYSFSGSIKLSIPDWMCRDDMKGSGCTIYDISLEDAILILDNHLVKLEEDLKQLNIEAQGNYGIVKEKY